MPMNLKLTLLALLSASCCNCSSFKGLGQQGPVISNLNAGESVKIEYSSTGCFGGSQYEMTFVRVGSQIGASGDRLLGYGKEKQRVPLTPIVLTANDVQQLESLIRRYRTPPPENGWSFSTTQSKLSLTKRSGEKVILRQSLDDSNGNSVEGKGALTIPLLADRMPEIRNGNQGRRMLPSR